MRRAVGACVASSTDGVGAIVGRGVGRGAGAAVGSDEGAGTTTRLTDSMTTGVFGTMMTSAGEALGRFVRGVVTLQPVEALRTE